MRVNAARVLLLVIALAVWEILSHVIPSLDFAVSKPTDIGSELWILLRAGDVHWHVLATGGAASAGLALGTVIGTVFGLVTWFSRRTTILLRPFVLALSAMPILAVAPLMIIWFGIGIQMKVALACLSTVFVAFAQSSRGAENVSANYLDVLRGMNADRWRTFIIAVVPGSLDWVFSAMKLNAGLALLGAFIGEFISSNVGLGYLVLRASSLYNVPRAIAASMLIAALALLFDWVASSVEVHRSRIIEATCIPKQVWARSVTRSKAV